MIREKYAHNHFTQINDDGSATTITNNTTSSIRNVHLHHIISCRQIKDFLKTHKSLSIAERRRQWDSYINQPHVKKLIVEAVCRLGSRRGMDGRILYASIMYNPHNLVAGPHPCQRVDDAKDDIDYAILDKQRDIVKETIQRFLNDTDHTFEIFASMPAAEPVYWHHRQNSSLPWIVFNRKGARPNSEDQEQPPIKKQKTSD